MTVAPGTLSDTTSEPVPSIYSAPYAGRIAPERERTVRIAEISEEYPFVAFGDLEEVAEEGEAWWSWRKAFGATFAAL